ncbi:MAG: Maf family nucleotide pyrophosphatase [Rikenellaceae bacterium]
MLLHDRLQSGGYRLILASQSPRRQQLLADAGLEFVTIKYEVDESVPEGVDVATVPEYLADLKSDGYPQEIMSQDIIITADTMVLCDGEILGKPADGEGAREMLRKLSGAEHQVITGVSLRSAEERTSFSASTRVWFRELSEEEIDHYVTAFRPMDKAGSYGIQEWIGYVGVERIDGSFYNVMGLPIQALYVALQEFLAK